MARPTAILTCGLFAELVVLLGARAEPTALANLPDLQPGHKRYSWTDVDDARREYTPPFAFPGAEGFDTNTQGGRGGASLRIDTLQDSLTINAGARPRDRDPVDSNVVASFLDRPELVVLCPVRRAECGGGPLPAPPYSRPGLPAPDSKKSTRLTTQAGHTTALPA